MLNLCINARDAMPDGGAIVIETLNASFDRPATGDWDLPPGRYVALSVSDNGTGMPAVVVARAFDPFFTTKPIGQGTGLGLSMIYGFARQSGGQVRIYSEVGEGTRVCLYLPRHTGEEERDAASVGPADLPRARHGETVLVVDDEASVRMLVTDVLGDLGYGALEAADGAAGLAFLRTDARIDLLVTDVGLPGGMNGRQVADAARDLRPGLKVLFITGYGRDGGAEPRPSRPRHARPHQAFCHRRARGTHAEPDRGVMCPGETSTDAASPYPTVAADRATDRGTMAPDG